MAQLRGLALQHVPQPEPLVRLLAAAGLRAEVSTAHCCAEAFDFDEATRYNDYAISPLEFHWESQSLTREASATGQRYIQHRERGSRMLLFVREENRRGGVTLPFLCLGFAGLREPRRRAADGDPLAAAQGDSGRLLPGSGCWKPKKAGR